MATTAAMIHSKHATDTVTIISHKDNNNVIAEYNGQRCTAIFNPFVGMYYVDDIYGKLPAAPQINNYSQSEKPLQKRKPATKKAKSAPSHDAR